MCSYCLEDNTYSLSRGILDRCYMDVTEGLFIEKYQRGNVCAVVLPSRQWLHLIACWSENIINHYLIQERAESVCQGVQECPLMGHISCWAVRCIVMANVLILSKCVKSCFLVGYFDQVKPCILVIKRDEP